MNVQLILSYYIKLNIYGYYVQTCDIPVLFLLVHYIQSSEAIHCRNSAHYIHLPRSLSLHLLPQALLQFDHLSLISKSNRQLNVNIVMYSKVKGRKLFAKACYLPFSHKLKDTFCTEIHFLHTKSLVMQYNIYIAYQTYKSLLAYKRQKCHNIIHLKVFHCLGTLDF